MITADHTLGGLSSFGEGGVGGTGSSYDSSSVGDRTLGSETGQSTTGSSGGVIGSALSYLGLGGQAGGQQSGVTGDNSSSYTSGTGSTAVGGSSSYGETSISSREPQFGSSSNSGYGSSAAETALGGAGIAGASSALGSERDTSSYGQSGNSSYAGQSGDTSYGGRSTGDLGPSNETYGSESTRGLGSDTLGGSSGTDSASREAVATRTPSDSNVHTGSDPIDSSVPAETETASAGTHGKDYEAKLHDKHASTRENVDAIPTAGGEKLGAKHWGESKIVPENPKPSAGVSSDEFSSKSDIVTLALPCSFTNTSLDTVRDNTNRNTGPASQPTGTGAHGKESLVDKVKDKLHLGNSLGSADAE